MEDRERGGIEARDQSHYELTRSTHADQTSCQEWGKKVMPDRKFEVILNEENGITPPLNQLTTHIYLGFAALCIIDLAETLDATSIIVLLPVSIPSQ